MSITDAALAAMLAENPDIAANEAPDFVPTEAQEQMRLFAWIDANTEQYPALRWAFHVPNGEYRDKATGGRLKAMGVRRGVPDVWLPISGHGFIGLEIELKRSDQSNKTTPEQDEWMAWLTEQGWHAQVCYGAASAIELMKWYLGIRQSP